jgi:NDP-mannose synthase
MQSDPSRSASRAILLAGGRGTRLAPYTTVLPKPLMPIGDMPVLEVLLRRLKYFGVSRATLCVGYLSSLIEAYFGDGSRWGIEIDYSRESEPLGTAGPLALFDPPDEPFIVTNGDLLTTLDFGEMYRFHRSTGAVATVGIIEREIAIEFGVIRTDAADRVTGYEEKPVLTHDVSMGVYVFDPVVLSRIPRGRPFDLPDLILAATGAGDHVAAYRCRDLWLDIGRYDDYSRAVELFDERGAEFLPEGS